MRILIVFGSQFGNTEHVARFTGMPAAAPRHPGDVVDRLAVATAGS